MAQTNFTPILLYASSTPTNVPSAGNLTNSATGSEIAINIADKNLFFKDSGGIVNTVPVRQSSTSSNGWLSSTDWNTFNNKAPATSGTSILYGNGSGGFSNVIIGTGVSFAGGTLSATGSGGTVTSVTGTAPVVSSGGTTPAISMPAATTSVNGYLTSTDWNTFNNKQPAGAYVTSVGATSPITSSGGTTPTIAMPAATTSVSGYLTSTDWNTFNNKGSGTVTSVTGTAPVVSSGGATPAISMAAATASVNGYLTSTDWTTFNNKGNGTVTSVAALTLGTTGTDLSSTVANGTTTPVITLNVPTASAANRGALSAADWTTFNSKAPGVTFTTGYVPFGQGTTTLNQDAGLFWNNTNKTLGIGTTTPGFPLTVISSTTLAAGNPSLVLQGSSNTERLQIRSATATGGQAIVAILSSRGSIASPTVTLNGDALGYYQLGGYNGTNFARGAWLSGFASGDWSGTNQGSFIGFSTTPNGSTTIAERMRLHASGGVSIGNTTDPGATNLSVTGTITSASSVTGTALLASDGTTNARIIPFSSSSFWGNTSNHPMYFQTNNNIQMTISAAGGVSIGTLTDPGVTNLIVAGTIASATTIKTGGYTVATLPTGVTGARAYVTNALAPSYGVAVVGGGAVTIPVFYNGTAWIAA